jgi:lysozyme
VSPYNAPFSTSVSNGPKFNPYHDELGRFTFGPHVSRDDSDDDQSGGSGSDDSDESNNTTGTPAANLNLTTTPLPNRSLSDDAQVVDASGQTGSAPITAQPAKDLSTSQQGVDFIANHERFGPNVYPDQGNRPTIGFGHLLQPGESYPNGITREDAEQLLANDIGTAETAVQNDVKVPLTQSQFDALVSFTYNEGAGNFGTSTLLQLLNQGDYTGAADQFPLWHYFRKPDGSYQSSDGLIARRNDERDLFLNGSY